MQMEFFMKTFFRQKNAEGQIKVFVPDKGQLCHEWKFSRQLYLWLYAFSAQKLLLSFFSVQDGRNMCLIIRYSRLL